MRVLEEEFNLKFDQKKEGFIVCKAFYRANTERPGKHEFLVGLERLIFAISPPPVPSSILSPFDCLYKRKKKCLYFLHASVWLSFWYISRLISYCDDKHIRNEKHFGQPYSETSETITTLKNAFKQANRDEFFTQRRSVCKKKITNHVNICNSKMYWKLE